MGSDRRSSGAKTTTDESEETKTIETVVHEDYLRVEKKHQEPNQNRVLSISENPSSSKKQIL